MSAQVIEMMGAHKRNRLRENCFDLMLQFYDRAWKEGALYEMRKFISAAARIHRGGSSRA